MIFEWLLRYYNIIIHVVILNIKIYIYIYVYILFCKRTNLILKRKIHITVASVFFQRTPMISRFYMVVGVQHHKGRMLAPNHKTGSLTCHKKYEGDIR